jgi:hypothetical protein
VNAPAMNIARQTRQTERHVGRYEHRLFDATRTIEIAKTAIKSGNGDLAISYLNKLSESIMHDLEFGKEPPHVRDR